MASKRFHRLIKQIAQGGLRAFARYPAAMSLALLLAAAASARLAVGGSPGWQQLFSAVQAAAFPGVTLGMAATALAVGRTRPRVWVAVGQVTAVLWTICAVLLLRMYEIWPTVVSARLTAIAILAFLGYHLILSRADLDIGYDEIWLISLRSLLIAALYGAVLLGGLALLVFAIENLLTVRLGAHIYQYLVIWSLWAGYAAFLGFMPDYTPEDPGDRLERGRQQPVFFQLLLQYVVIPLLMWMTLVLLIWSVRMIVRGVWPPFSQLTTILSAYAVLGIATAILTASYRRPLAIWFRRVFPIVALVFLVLQTYAIGSEIAQNGLRTGSYIAMLTSIGAGAAAVVLLWPPLERQRQIGWIAMALLWLAVLPGVGYLGLPAWSQATRLETTLIRNGMLAGGQIIPARAALSADDQARIVTAVAYFHQEAHEAPRPAWLVSSLPDLSAFEKVFGFVFLPPAQGPEQPPAQRALYLVRQPGALPLIDYDLAVSLGDLWGQPDPIHIQGKRGRYTVTLAGFTRNGPPRIRLERDGYLLPEPDLLHFLEGLAAKYQADDKPQLAAYEDMLLPLESEGVHMLLVLRSVEARIAATGAPDNWFIQVEGLYFRD